MNDDRDKSIGDYVFKNAGRHQYEVPTYQRGYEWENDNVEEFWSDLLSINKKNSGDHFFGNLFVTQEKRIKDTIVIVDGQQRITTCALLLICARDIFYKSKNLEKEKYFKAMQNRLYASDNAIDPNESKPLLKLSRANRDFFQNYLLKIKDKDDPKKPDMYIKNDSNRKLFSAYKKLLDHLKKHSKDTEVESINGLINTMLRKFSVNYYTFPNSKQVYKIFNLMNNRGLPLDPSDLIKNHLFGTMDDANIDQYDEIWNSIRNTIEDKEEASSKQDIFFHHYLISAGRFYLDKESKIIQRDVFDEFEKLTDLPSKKSTDIIDDLKIWASYYAKIRMATDEFKDFVEIQHYLKKIKDINAVFLYPALLVGYKKYWDMGDKLSFEKLVKMCFMYHIRVKAVGTAIGLEEYGSKMQEITADIHEGFDIDEIINHIIKDSNYYPNDNKFSVNLKEYTVANSKLAIALLEEVEFEFSNKHSLTNISLEHIMPKSLRSAVEYLKNHIPQDEHAIVHAQYKNRLGNLTLLSKKNNSSASSKIFSEKLKTYKEDNTYEITKKLLEYKKWTPEEIKERQEIFAEKLVERVNLEKLLNS